MRREGGREGGREGEGSLYDCLGRSRLRLAVLWSV